MIASSTHAQNNIVSEGKADFSLSERDYTSRISLAGEWEIYPNQLLTPQDFKAKKQGKVRYIKVPSLWEDNEKFPELASGKGFATYRLVAKFPKTNSLSAIRIREVKTSCKLWVNDSLLLEMGKVGTSEDEMEGARKSITAIFESSDEVQIVMQVSNFVHKKGGVVNSPFIGKAEIMTSYTATRNNIDIFLIGVLLIMAVYHIALYLLRRSNKPALYLGLLLFSFMVNMGVNGEQVLSSVIYDFPWFLQLKLGYTSYYVAALFMILFFRVLYPNEIRKWIVITSYCVLGFLFLATLVLPPVIFSEFLIVYEVYSLFLVLYIMYALIKAVFRKKDGVIYNFIGTLAIFGAAVNDIMFDMMLITTGKYLPAGIFIFVFFQTFMLSRSFSNMFNKTDELNLLMSNLDKIKNNLLTASTFNLKDTVRILINNANAERGMLFVLSDNKPILNTICHPNNSETEELDSSYPIRIIEKTIEQNTAVVVRNTEKRIHYFGPNYLEKFNTKSALCVPLLAGNEIKAIIYLENFTKNAAFNSENVKVLELLANQITALIDNASIYGNLTDANKGLEDTVQLRIAEINNQKEELLTQRDEIDNQKKFLDNTYSQISLQHDLIGKSISYAKGIQQSILPEATFLTDWFNDGFICYKPKEELSGDFYWGQATKDDIIFAAVDCTGHGVPGALMSVVGANLLNSAVNVRGLQKPSEILDYMQYIIKKQLNQSGKKEDSKDGMDMSVVNYNPKTQMLQFAAARNPGFLIRDGEITEIKADRMSIGGAAHARVSADKRFANQLVKIEKDDILYLFSDGYVDQLGERTGRKFMKKAFKSFLVANSDLTMKEQLDKINSNLIEWQGKLIQNDDILVAGIKF